MQDLKTEKGRENELNLINKSFIDALQNACLITNNNTSAVVYERGISICLEDEHGIGLFGSSFNINRTSITKDFSINIPSGGSITPEDKSECWRIIQAADMLKNWATVTEIAGKHCQMYCDLKAEILKVNKV